MYQQILLNEADNYRDHINIKRVINCPFCNVGVMIDFRKYITNECSHKRHLDDKKERSFQCDSLECPTWGKVFSVDDNIHEYPIEVYSRERIQVKESVMV